MDKKLNLVLHCGANRVSRRDVELVGTPERTKTWTPIPHVHLLELVERTLDSSGLRVINEAHALARHGDRYFALLQVGNGRKDEDYGLVAGLRNSHDKSFPGGLVLGQAPFVCDNLSFFGEVKFTRRHTRYIERDLPGLVDRALGKLMSLRRSQDFRVARYKDQTLTDREAHHLIIAATDARVIPNAKIPKVLDQWRKPEHEEFEERNVWSFYNGVTSVLKEGSLFTKPKASEALHGLLDAYVGLGAA